jgi:hypothetical protein
MVAPKRYKHPDTGHPEPCCLKSHCSKLHCLVCIPCTSTHRVHYTPRHIPLHAHCSRNASVCVRQPAHAHVSKHTWAHTAATRMHELAWLVNTACQDVVHARMSWSIGLQNPNMHACIWIRSTWSEAQNNLVITGAPHLVGENLQWFFLICSFSSSCVLIRTTWL